MNSINYDFIDENVMSKLPFIISENLSVSDKIKGFFKALDIFCKINSIRVFLRFSKTYSNYY